MLIPRSSATALQPIKVACDTLLSSKAKAKLTGGFNDLGEEGSYEFANMKAMSNAETEFAIRARNLQRCHNLRPLHVLM